MLVDIINNVVLLTTYHILSLRNKAIYNQLYGELKRTDSPLPQIIKVKKVG